MALADQGPQCAEQRRVRKLTVSLLNAFAAEDEGGRVQLPRPSDELAYEPRLADAGFAG
jgi:hypothetical protein